MASTTPAQPPPISKARRKHPDLLFEWSRSGSRRWSLLFFLNLSLALHVACFYAFQVVYPPSVRQRAETTKITYLDPDDPEVRDVIARIEDRAVFFDGSLRQGFPGTSQDDLDDVVLTPGFATHEPELLAPPEIHAPADLPPVFGTDRAFLPPLSRLLPGGEPLPRPQPFLGPFVYTPVLIPFGQTAERELLEPPDWSDDQKIIAEAPGNRIRFLVEIDRRGRVSSCVPWAGVEAGFDAAMASKLETELRYQPYPSDTRGWLELRW